MIYMRTMVKSTGTIKANSTAALAISLRMKNVLFMVN